LGILSNLTADNKTNKSLLVKLNGVQTLMQKLIMNADRQDDFTEAAVSLNHRDVDDSTGVRHVAKVVFCFIHTYLYF
jgi:hypothetical protein